MTYGTGCPGGSGVRNSLFQFLQKGCYAKIEDYVEDNSKKILVVSVIVVVVMVSLGGGSFALSFLRQG